MSGRPWHGKKLPDYKGGRKRLGVDRTGNQIIPEIGDGIAVRGMPDQEDYEGIITEVEVTERDVSGNPIAWSIYSDPDTR